MLNRHRVLRRHPGAMPSRQVGAGAGAEQAPPAGAEQATQAGAEQATQVGAEQATKQATENMGSGAKVTHTLSEEGISEEGIVPIKSLYYGFLLLYSEPVEMTVSMGLKRHIIPVNSQCQYNVHLAP